MISLISGNDFSNMIINASSLINIHKQSINDLNVFPVPDGDTGTNMSMTINAGAIELSKKMPASVGAAASITANALLRGARGNSGVILSLLFRGIAKHLKDLESASVNDFALALQEGVSAAYKAVMKPTEGTILTVSRLSADEAVRLSEDTGDFVELLRAVINTGKIALDDTINQNPVLQKAGVIDAGGAGFIVILQGMLDALLGNMVSSDADNGDQTIKDAADFTQFDQEEINFTYCTEFIVGKENDNPTQPLREFLSEIGDSIVMVDDDEIIKVHVHTNEPGNVLTRALTYGPLLTVKIENMREQHTNLISEDEQQQDTPSEPLKQYGTVAVCAGDGMMEVFKDLGVDMLVTGGQTMNPSTDDILAAIEKTPAETVFILPNNKNIIMAAQQCVDISNKKVIVIPTKTVPQGISALINMDPDQGEEELVQAFNDAASGVHTVLVTYAARDSVFDGHSINAGEYLALLEGALLCNSSDFQQVVNTVADIICGFEPEIVTVFYGEDVDEDSANQFGSAFEKLLPHADTSVIYGGQPVYYYMISAE